MPRSATTSTSTSRQDKASVLDQFLTLIIVATILGTAVTAVYISPILFPKNATLSGTVIVTDINGNIIPTTNQISLSTIYTPTQSGSIVDEVSLRPNTNITGGYASATTWGIKCGLSLSLDGVVKNKYACGAIGSGVIPVSISLGSISLTGVQLNQLLSGASKGTHSIAFSVTSGNLTITITSCTQCGQTVSWTPKVLGTLNATIS